MDNDGDGEISETEYVLFNLIARREVDIDEVNALKDQFKAMDADGSGSLEIDDFPTTVCIKETSMVCNNEIVHVHIDVVPTTEAGDLLEHYDRECTMTLHQGEHMKSYRDVYSSSQSPSAQARELTGDQFFRARELAANPTQHSSEQNVGNTPSPIQKTPPTPSTHRVGSKSSMISSSSVSPLHANRPLKKKVTLDKGDRATAVTINDSTGPLAINENTTKFFV
jgi:hypothetical protein